MILKNFKKTKQNTDVKTWIKQRQQNIKALSEI